MSSIFKKSFLSPLGNINIESSPNFIQKITFADSTDQEEQTDSPLLREAQAQLQAYFDKKLYDFTFPHQAVGTDFQQKVWAYLKEIPYGRTISYKDLALALGNKLLIRAAANANAQNPLAILVPCHRVIGSDGSLVGYAGGLWRKDFLLNLEKQKNNLF